MSLEKHIRETILKTALLHMLKNQSKSPERICRNIRELLSSIYPEAQEIRIEDDRLLHAIKALPIDQLINWLLTHIQSQP